MLRLRLLVSVLALITGAGLVLVACGGSGHKGAVPCARRGLAVDIPCASLTAGLLLVQSTGASETSASTSMTALFGTPTGAGDLLVLSASAYTGISNPITSVTDSAGNSWQRAGVYSIAGRYSDGEMWYSAGAGPATSVTVHTASPAVISLSVQEFSGVAASSPLDAVAGTSGQGTAPASGQITSPAGDLVVGFAAGHGSAQPITTTAPGYVVQGQQNSLAGQVTSVVTGYQIPAAAGGQNFTARLGATAYWAAGIAAFRPVPTAPGDFSVSASPTPATLAPGQPATVTVSTSATSGAAQPIVLTVSGLPSGASASFSAAINAGQQSTLTILAPRTQAAGSFTLTITATGPSTTHTVTVPLTVSPLQVIRAAFYYPWFPEGWNQQGQNPFTNYRPARGFYSTTPATVAAQIQDMQYGGISMGIASWFGPRTITDKHWPAIMQAAGGTGFTWAPYYEAAAMGRQTPQQIAGSLHYLMATYGGTGSALASLPGRGMVVFVYNANDLSSSSGCLTVSAWDQAQVLLRQQYGEQVYVDLKTFPGYQTCPGVSGIGGWHQYGPNSPAQSVVNGLDGGSYSISPGFWKSGTPYGTGTFLARDLARWQAGIAAMNASGAQWQLITTYNEWGEGTAIESAAGCRAATHAGAICDWSAGNTTSQYMTALHNAPAP
jgi:hypothetical protein